MAKRVVKKVEAVKPVAPKLTMDDREKMYFHKLPRSLRDKIAKALGMPDLIPPDGRTARRTQKRYRVELRGSWEKLCDVFEAAAIVKKSPHYLQVAISLGRGVASFRDGDDIYSVERVGAPHLVTDR